MRAYFTDTLLCVKLRSPNVIYFVWPVPLQNGEALPYFEWSNNCARVSKRVRGGRICVLFAWKMALLVLHLAVRIADRCQDSIQADRFSDRNEDMEIQCRHTGTIKKAKPSNEKGAAGKYSCSSGLPRLKIGRVYPHYVAGWHFATYWKMGSLVMS